MSDIMIIYCLQRSGSTALVQSLRKNLPNSVTVYEEILLKEPVNETLKLYPDFYEILPEKRFYEQEHDLEEYISNLKAGSKLLVFKVMLDQVSSELKDFVRNNKVYSIYFSRNIVACAKSSARIKSGFNKAHNVNEMGMIGKTGKTKISFRYLLLILYYCLKNTYHICRNYRIINHAECFRYPEFSKLTAHIKGKFHLY